MAGRFRVYDMDVRYEVVHRDVKYPRLEFKTGDLLLVLPKNYKDHEDIMEKHKDWIYEKSSLINEALREAQGKGLKERTNGEFRELVHAIVDDTSRELKLSINKVYFRRMKSKWGSCSSRKNLTVNTLLNYLPENLIEYVIYHEMAHLIEKRHNERFWNMISRRFNRYQEKEKDLLVYWFSIQRNKHIQAAEKGYRIKEISLGIPKELESHE